MARGAPTLLAAALCCGLARAEPAPRAVTIGPSTSFMTVDATAPWVSVDDNGQPARTVTPSMTTVSGTPSVVDAAPHDLTASVFSWTSYAIVTVSTGAPPNPTATKAPSPEGAFSRCFNRHDDLTWDPDFYNQTHGNDSYQVAVRLDYLNHTSNQMVKLDVYDRVPARWGYWPFKLTSEHLMGRASNNVTITLLASPEGSDEKNQSIALPVVLARPSLPPSPPTPTPSRTAILVAVPGSLGVFVLILLGLCFWHRQTRRINISNVMGRARRGYSGRRQRRLLRSADKDRAIQLQAAPLSPLGPHYRDDLYRPRRDSDALGSLAGSPAKDTFDAPAHGDGHGRNAFRDELRRQAQERRDY